MSEPMKFRQARPDESDFQAVIDFLNNFEGIVEDGIDPKGNRLDNWGEKHDAFDNLLDASGEAFFGSWRRVIFAGQCAIQNACDPDLDYLDFKPEIKAAMAGVPVDGGGEGKENAT